MKFTCDCLLQVTGTGGLFGVQWSCFLQHKL